VVDGESVFLQTPTVNLQWTEQFLLQIKKLWDLIQDHTSNKLRPTIERLDQVVAMHLRD